MSIIAGGVLIYVVIAALAHATGPERHGGRTVQMRRRTRF